MTPTVLWTAFYVLLALVAAALLARWISRLGRRERRRPRHDGP